MDKKDCFFSLAMTIKLVRNHVRDWGSCAAPIPNSLEKYAVIANEVKQTLKDDLELITYNILKLQNND
jgi:hypothetical protein